MDFLVSPQQDKQENDYLERVNADLSKSLRRCHALVDDCRFMLASNSNDCEPANDAELAVEVERDEA
ncbi:MAG TPA: hypothetical protein VFW39_02070 [Sphingomicrobium sp.]|nr:hypothetical protein [Sphingomicrobium sp.]